MDRGSISHPPRMATATEASMGGATGGSTEGGIGASAGTTASWRAATSSENASTHI
jgi:hypothetical protein